MRWQNDRPKMAKPCPFCGSEASQITQVIDGWVKYDEPRTYYVVGCKNCGVGFRKPFMWEAIELWNRRVQESE